MIPLRDFQMRFLSIKFISRIASVIVVAMGFLVLVGWAFDFTVLKSIFSDCISMKVNTAVSFILMGVSLWLLRNEEASRFKHGFAQSCAFAVFLLSVLTLSQDIFAWNLGIDQLLFKEPMNTIGTVHPGRMAPLTAFSFILLSLSLVLLNNRNVTSYLWQFLVIVVAPIPLAAFVGYIYGVEPLYGPFTLEAMAFHTAILLEMLCVGILFARPNQGVMSVVTNNSLGGAMARRMFPLAVGIPVILGIIRFAGERAGFYNAEFGLIFLVLTNILAISCLIWWNAALLYRLDRKRKQAEEALQKACDNLDRRIQERTRELASTNEVLQTEINERKKVEEQLLHNALFDLLTELPNRVLFLERLGQALERSKRYPDYFFAILCLDIDRFKVINDSLGHSIGNDLLIATAHRIKKCISDSGTLARLTGDVFAILLENGKSDGSPIYVANCIRTELALPFNLEGHEIFVTTSIGIALNTQEYEHPEDILRDAHTAMHHAKVFRKGHYSVYDKSMHSQAVEALNLEAELRRAIDQEEFRIHYQPIVSLETGKITGCEALVRWQHPRRGLLAPGEFISQAEETGLIVPLGDWVLKTACAQNKAWQKKGLSPLYVSVNLSALQLKEKNFSSAVKQTLKETGLDPRFLKLELTENIIMENPNQTAMVLRGLNEIGTQACLDDFGTGYSWLTYLRHSPFQILKIDRSFVRDVIFDPYDAAIVKAIVTLAHSLQLKVTAEGVETPEQLVFLRSLGCHEIQGFLFSRPVPPEDFSKLVEEGLSLSPAFPFPYKMAESKDLNSDSKQKRKYG